MALPRYIKSGSGRARGPGEDERSGLDFVIRTIGRHPNKKSASITMKGADSDSENSDSADDVDVVGSSGSMGSVGSVSANRPDDQSQKDPSLVADPLTMSTKQLREIAGESADDVACAYFQHTSRVTQPAFFRSMASMLTVTTEKGETKLFRKGQAANHPKHGACCGGLGLRLVLRACAWWGPWRSPLVLGGVCWPGPRATSGTARRWSQASWCVPSPPR